MMSNDPGNPVQPPAPAAERSTGGGQPGSARAERERGRAQAPAGETRRPRKPSLLASTIHKVLQTAFFIVVLLFLAAGILLIIFSGVELWAAFRPPDERSINERFIAVLECIGLLTIAVAALELAQTILEEEIQREMSISAPTRVRRFLSRFLVVVVVALTIECLVSIFRSAHDAPEMLPYAASVGVAAAALLIGWGVFIRFNAVAEELEPQAIEEAQAEDAEVRKGDD